ncbi:MAG: MBL fold metallo-hydrolase [Planctomycetota bacterium]|jgi:ribonuclease BN (tRNA processing enzyme)|nr:MBL fold metallo-hydrolase [Planctomycetota bacterium]
MRVTILGSGTSIPVPDRFPAGYLVQEDGTNMLIDIGPGTLRRLAQAGVKPDEITAVLLTHFHTDHTGDLPALLFTLRDPLFAGRPPLRLIAHHGLAEWLDHLTAAWPWLAADGYALSVEEIGPGSFPVEQLTVKAVRVAHTPQSLAYRIESPDGGIFTFSGDVEPCSGLIEAARNADLFICDCSFPDGQGVPGHMTPGLAGEHAEKAGARRLCLTHFYPQCDGHDLEAQARATFSGKVLLAEDLMKVEIRGY